MNKISSIFGGGSLPIGAVMEVSGVFDATNTDYLQANGSSIVNTDYPSLATKLAPSLAATMRGLPGATNLLGVAYGNGIYLAIVGYNGSGVAAYTGYALTSTNGTIWNVNSIYHPHAGTNDLYRGVSFANGYFYLTLSYSANSYTNIDRSTDGTTWANVAANIVSSYSLYVEPYYYYDYAVPSEVFYVNNVYFVLHDSYSWNAEQWYRYTYSTDGVTWVTATGGGYRPSAIAYGNSTYVIVDRVGTTFTSASHSSGWTARSNATGLGGWNSVAFGNNVFVSAHPNTSTNTTVGYSSNNGVTWTTSTVPSGAHCTVIYANSLFVLIGTNYCATSPDGVTWTARTMPTGTWTHITYTPSGFVVSSTSSTSIVVTSTDGVTWTANNIAPIQYFNAISRGPSGTFLASTTANGVVKSTDDGVSWFTTNSTSTSSIAYSPTLNLYAGVQGGTAIYTSTDGATWTSRKTLTSGVFPAATLTWENNRFIHLYSGLSYSTDGVSWSDIYPVAGVISMSKVVYGNGVYTTVATAAETKVVYTSTNLTQWTTSVLPNMAYWSAIAYGNGIFVLLSKNNSAATPVSLSGWVSATNFGGSGTLGSTTELSGIIYCTSTDGYTWVPRYLPVPGNWSSIHFTGSLFIAVDTSTNNYLYSLDGIGWSIGIIPVTGAWNLAATGATGTTIMVPNGLPSTVARLTVSTSSSMLPIIPSKAPGATYVIKAK